MQQVYGAGADGIGDIRQEDQMVNYAGADAALQEAQ